MPVLSPFEHLHSSLFSLSPVTLFPSRSFSLSALWASLCRIHRFAYTCAQIKSEIAVVHSSRRRRRGRCRLHLSLVRIYVLQSTPPTNQNKTTSPNISCVMAYRLPASQSAHTHTHTITHSARPHTQHTQITLSYLNIECGRASASVRADCAGAFPTSVPHIPQNPEHCARHPLRQAGHIGYARDRVQCNCKINNVNLATTTTGSPKG